MDGIGVYGDSLEIDTNDKGCTRQWKYGEMVRSARIEEKGMIGFGDDKMKMGLEWGEWKDGHDTVSKEYSSPNLYVIQEEVL